MGVHKAEESVIPESKLELHCAGVENRLRGMLTELMTPTIRKIQLHDEELDSLRTLVSGHAGQLSNMSWLKTKVGEIKAMLDDCNQEMTKLGHKVHASVSQCSDETKHLQAEVDGLSKRLEQKESAILHLQRSLDRAAAEVSRLQQTFDERTEDIFQARLDEHHRSLHKLICELEAKLVGCEMQHAALTDRIWGEEMALARVTGEVRALHEPLEQLRGNVHELQSDQVTQSHLLQLRNEVSKLTHQTRMDIDAVRQNVGAAVVELKEHLRTGLQAAVTHNAGLFNEVESNCKKELQLSMTVRDETAAFIERCNNRITTVEEHLNETSDKCTKTCMELLTEVEDGNKQRKKDRSNMEVENKAFQHRLLAMSENLDLISAGMTRFSVVVDSLIEASKMQAALELQDTADREGVYLAGLREVDPDKKAALDMTLPSAPVADAGASPGKSPRKGRSLMKGNRIVSIDQRCLSCSSQSPNVLAAFKMACLQYKPSPVAFGSKHESRFDLLQRLNVILQSAATEANQVRFPRGHGARMQANALSADASPKPPDGSGVGRRVLLTDKKASFVDVLGAMTSSKGGKLPQLSGQHHAQPAPSATIGEENVLV